MTNNTEVKKEITRLENNIKELDEDIAKKNIEIKIEKELIDTFNKTLKVYKKILGSKETDITKK